jgi:hypothetical protein
MPDHYLFRHRQTKVYRTSVAAACLIGSIVTCSHAQQPNTQPDEPKTGSISGRVVNESGQPLAGAAVFVRGAGPSIIGRTTTSNIEGNFQVNGLDNGLYYVSANSPAYVAPPPDIDTPTPTYRVGDTVRIELIRGGVITGTITNSQGEPVVSVRVRAHMVRNAAGQPTKGAVLSFGERTTDDRGIYRIFGLAPGTYLVQAGGAGNNQTSVNATDFDAPTYAPSSTRDTASEIQVRGGEEATVDIRYRGEQGHAISGTVKTQGTSGASISLMQAGDGVMPTSGSYQPAAARGFTISGLADGDYEITAQEVVSTGSTAFPDVSVSDRLRVTVKGADVTGLELVPKPLASIAGRIILEPAKLTDCQNKRQPLFSETMIALVQNRKDTNVDPLALMRLFVGSSAPDKDGTFVLRNVRQGQYSFSPRFFARYWYLKSMTIGSASPSASSAKTAPAPTIKDAARNWSAVKSGDRITGVTITLSEGAASVRGELAKSEDTRIVAGLRVYLVPSERDKADDPLRYFTSEIASDGTFSLNNLPPGRYWTLTQQPEPNSPTSTEKLRLPDSAEARTKIRRAAETSKSEIELNPCQNVTDFKLPRL